jgi:hypothetical protein
MATQQFADLTKIPSQNDVWNQELLPALQNPPSGVAVRVTDWFVGGVYRTMGMAVAQLRVLSRIAIATLTYAGFEDYVFGRTQVPTPAGGTPIDVTGWAPLLFKQRYGGVQSPATFTLRQFVLTNTSAVAYTNLKDGAMIVQFPSGNRYIIQGARTNLSAAIGAADVTATVSSTAGFPATGTIQIDSEQIGYTGLTSSSFTGLVRGTNGTTATSHINASAVSQTITIPAQVGITPGTLTTVFRSEFQYSASSTYNADGSASAISLVTAQFPGVTVTNPTTTYSAVAQSGPGVGTVAPSGVPSGSHAVSIQIVTTGTLAAVTAGWQYAVDGGAWSATQTGASVSNIGGFGINVTLADNGGSPSFLAGTVFYFTNPGSDILQTGQTAQTPQSMGAQAAGMWPALAFQRDANGNSVPVSPTANAYVLLAFAASTNVAIAFAQVDSTINNLVRVIIAGQNGVPSVATTVAAVQQFFNALQMLTDNVLVATSTQRTITLGLSSGSIQVKQAQLASAQATLQQRLQAYFGGTDPLAPLSINGLVDYDYVLSLIRTLPGVPPGGVPVGALTINGAAQNIQLPVTPAAFEVCSFSQNVATALSWSGV